MVLWCHGTRAPCHGYGTTAPGHHGTIYVAAVLSSAAAGPAAADQGLCQISHITGGVDTAPTPTLHLHYTYTYTTPTLHLHYTTPTLHLHYTYTTPTLHLHYTYITAPTLHLHLHYTAPTLHLHYAYTALPEQTALTAAGQD
jgi:hypothetical protein